MVAHVARWVYVPRLVVVVLVVFGTTEAAEGVTRRVRFLRGGGGEGWRRVRRCSVRGGGCDRGGGGDGGGGGGGGDDDSAGRGGGDGAGSRNGANGGDQSMAVVVALVLVARALCDALAAKNALFAANSCG